MKTAPVAPPNCDRGALFVGHLLQDDHLRSVLGPSALPSQRSKLALGRSCSSIALAPFPSPGAYCWVTHCTRNHASSFLRVSTITRPARSNGLAYRHDTTVIRLPLCRKAAFSIVVGQGNGSGTGEYDAAERTRIDECRCLDGGSRL
jgi:hypothetical protein